MTLSATRPTAARSLVALAMATSPLGCLQALPEEPPSLSGGASGARVESEGPERAAIEQQPICVGSAVASFGELSDTLYYRAAVLPGGALAVGYFAFFSDERPWGNNWLTWTLLPALAIDLVYTRALFVAPGLQRALSGKGDVEGFHVIYRRGPGDALWLERAGADDSRHRPVALTAEDALRMDPSRPTFYAESWSHQLSGRGLSRASELAYLHCYGRGHIRALPETVARDFALHRRAAPAHLEALGGRPLGGPGVAQAPSLRPPM
jgi:hypothetical protein